MAYAAAVCVCVCVVWAGSFRVHTPGFLCFTRISNGKSNIVLGHAQTDSDMGIYSLFWLTCRLGV
jgi:hypothetical protein